MFTNPHNQNLLNDVMRVLNGETTEQPIRPIPTWLSEAAVEAVNSLNEAYNSGEVMTLEIQRDIFRKHLSEAVSNCNCEVSKDTPIQFEEAIAEAKRVGSKAKTWSGKTAKLNKYGNYAVVAADEDGSPKCFANQTQAQNFSDRYNLDGTHHGSGRCFYVAVSLEKGEPAGAGAKKEEFEEAIAEAKRAGNRPMTGVPAGASKEDHEKARKANPFKVGLSKGVPAGAGAKKEEFEDVNEANQRLRKPKPHEEVYYKWFDGVEVSIMDMSKISKEIQAALDRKADLDKVMPELVKKYGKNSPTKKEEFEEDELDEAKKSPSEKLQRFVGMNMFSPMVNKADWTDSYMEVNKSGKIVGILDNSELDGKHGYVAVYWNPTKKKVMLGNQEEHSDAWARRSEVKENFQDVNEAHQSGSFAAFFKTKADSTFATNALRFRTEAEAKEYGRDLFNKWLGASEWKVMPHTDKPNTEIVNHVMKDIKESSHNSEEFEEMVMESDPTELELREFLTQLTSEEVTILRSIINETR